MFIYLFIFFNSLIYVFWIVSCVYMDILNKGLIVVCERLWGIGYDNIVVWFLMMDIWEVFI